MTSTAPGSIAIGLISDTHGLLRSSVALALAGVQLVLHAGDVGSADIIYELETIAPVLAVYGNTDAAGSPRLVDARTLEVGGLTIHLSHGHELGQPTPERLLRRYDADVIVFGHTHKPLVVRAQGRLVVNPGAAGPRRFSMRPSVARLVIADGAADATVVELDE